MDKPVLIVASSDDKALIKTVSESFIKELGHPIDFEIIQDEKISGGFIAIIDGKVYDASFSARLNELNYQLKKSVDEDTPGGISFEDVSGYLRQRVEAIDVESSVYDYGVVQSIADDIIQIKGLTNCGNGELLAFDDGVMGIALDIRLGSVGAALLNGSVSTSSTVRLTGKVCEVCVGDALIGRVINPLGQPLDGRELSCDLYMPIESPAPTIMDRSPVNTPLETGIIAVDSMIPIGRGQRELIIGDRQTGKTSIALSAIINQRDKDVVCVYCAIGQKASTVSGIVNTLRNSGAMDHTIVVCAFGSDTAAMQYIAPYAACAIAEYFMRKGRDALVVYDDLSKHAVAYRTMSLLLRRPSGREAYPGDVFYLHSRLLERAAHLSEEQGGGSITALPIVETMVGDISAYIPTNIISITDGQIYLEAGLYSAGQRPAINVGLSVSRVGSAAQHRAMIDVSGRLRLDVAQYREMAVFAQFGADLDEVTAGMLKKGERLTELLKQPVEEMLPLSEQVALLLACETGLFRGFEVGEARAVKAKLLRYLSESAGSLMNDIQATKKLSDEVRAGLLARFDLFLEMVQSDKGGEADGKSA